MKMVLHKSRLVAAFHCCPALQMMSSSFHLGDSVLCAEIQVNKIDTSDSMMINKPRVWPTVRAHVEEYINICMHCKVGYSLCDKVCVQPKG